MDQKHVAAGLFSVIFFNVMTDDFHLLITNEWMEDGILHVGLLCFYSENFIPSRMQWNKLHIFLWIQYTLQKNFIFLWFLRLSVALLFIFFKVDAWELSIMYGGEIFYTSINMRLRMNVLEIQYQRLNKD